MSLINDYFFFLKKINKIVPDMRKMFACNFFLLWFLFVYLCQCLMV